MPVPLPFIRGIGRTRGRDAAEGGAPPPAVHIQTITLEIGGEPVAAAEDEAAAAPLAPEADLQADLQARTHVATAGPAGEPAERPGEPEVPRTESAAITEAWEVPAEAPGSEQAEARPEAVEVVPEAEPAVEVTPSWEAEPPADAPWAAAAAPPPQEPLFVPEPEEDAPAASAARIDAEPAPRPVSRPEPIEARARRKGLRGPEGSRPRLRRPGASNRRDPGAREGASVIPLTTGSAVQPRVPVNLTEQDIEASDELYEVEALLDAITGATRKRPSPPPAPETRPPRREQQSPEPDDASLGSAVRPRRPEDRPFAARDRLSGLARPAPAANLPEPTPARRVEQAPKIPLGAAARPTERSAPRPAPRRTEARPAEQQAAPPKPPARRRPARPVTVILVDEEGRPQDD